MASTLPKPPSPPIGGVSFSSRSGLGIAMPPAPPPTKPKYGAYCFKATCSVVDPAAPRGCPVGRVIGYDKTPGVAKDTEHACRMHARTLNTPKTKYACTEAQVVMLTSSDKECSGQIFFATDAATKRIV